MKKIAVFPGSFDPITLGHLDIIQRASILFDEVFVAIGVNTTKAPFISIERREDALKQIIKNSNISIRRFEGLTVNFCKSVDASFIVRGIRNNSDMDYERQIAEMNRSLDSGIETIFLLSRPEFAHISSTLVKEIYKNGGDISGFVPEGFLAGK